MYVNFLNVQQSMRYKIPFGIAQIGKAFRNEITPSHSIFRTREFEQMEMQFFTLEQDSNNWFEYWREERKQQLLSLGLKETELHFKAHSKEELAHYAKLAEDIEFDFPWGRRELEGLHNRGDFDLSRHQQFSGKKLQYFCSKQNKSYLPYVIETSIGADRLFLAVLCSAYT
ncbi:MAG: glycine--tRNA ligase, partial [Oligoflexia bacterium]|nr:glycine--tRNA ligase [Oligoflexia bacterium]